MSFPPEWSVLLSRFKVLMPTILSEAWLSLHWCCGWDVFTACVSQVVVAVLFSSENDWGWGGYSTAVDWRGFAAPPGPLQGGGMGGTLNPQAPCVLAEVELVPSHMGDGGRVRGRSSCDGPSAL